MLSVCSIALIVFFIYYLASYDTDGTLKGVLIAYIVLEAISKFDTIVILALVLLLPIIFIVMCCVCCCCKPAEGEENPIIQIPVL